MLRKISFLLGLVGLAIFVLSLNMPVEAAPNVQLTDFPTPTPLPDGRILYTVQPDDTLWRISAITSVSIDELRQLNNLAPGDVIAQNQVLLIGIVAPTAQPTEEAPEVAPTESPAGPTPTQGPGTALVCVLLFEDANGDSFHQEDEVSIAGGAVSVSERNGLYSETGNTVEGTADEPAPAVCFEDAPEGDYNITVAIPDEYNPTTVLNKALELKAGDEAQLNFGAQLSSQALSESPPPSEGGTDPVLGVVGALFLLVGIGLGIYSFRVMRK